MSRDRTDPDSNFSKLPDEQPNSLDDPRAVDAVLSMLFAEVERAGPDSPLGKRFSELFAAMHEGEVK